MHVLHANSSSPDAGAAATPVATLIADSNTPSTSTAQPVKLRLVNGLNGTTASATLAYNYDQVGDGAASLSANNPSFVATSAALARLEARIALERLTARFPKLRPGAPPVRRPPCLAPPSVPSLTRPLRHAPSHAPLSPSTALCSRLLRAERAELLGRRSAAGSKPERPTLTCRLRDSRGRHTCFEDIRP